MGLSEWIARRASRHTHALVVEVPGAWRTRVATERAMTARGWRLAVSPADADVLVVCGEPGPRLGEAIELVWDQMPGPRVRVEARSYDDVATCLDEAQRELLDSDHHRHDAQHRPTASDLLAEEQEQQEQHGGGHEGMDHGGGHEGMDHGDMEMSPGGIALADGGEDRDGLEMDVLRVRLGPVLAHWPAGLVLRCGLQGDVVTEAEAELLEGEAPLGDPGAPVARRLDNIASLLVLAGWGDAAAEARAVRDVAVQASNEPTAERVQRLRRRVLRSRTLRWSLRGLRSLSEQDVRRLGLPDDAVGDTHDRLTGMLERATHDDARGAGHAAAAGAGHRGRTVTLDALSAVVTGLDLAAARLVVASLDLEDLQSHRTGREGSHG